MTLELTLTIDAAKFKNDIDAAAEGFDSALSATKNIIASMILDQSTTDISNAGKFGENYLTGLKVTVDGDQITTTLDSPGASIFEDGGIITGDPLLWIGISGTDAEGVQASAYGDKLFSVNRKSGGAPLLFSITDKQPKYFGISSVTIPKKFHLKEIQLSVMENFKAVFQSALKD